MTPRELKGVKNLWRRKHQVFLQKAPGIYKKQERKLHMDKMASKCAKLKLTRCIDSNWVHLRSTNVEFLDLSEPFSHECCCC